MKSDFAAGERAALMEAASGCLCQKARHAARILTRFYDRHFAGGGMEPTQFNLLVAIRLFGSVPVRRLANRLGLERTTLTRNIELLRRDGLVEIQAGQDARQRLLSLTPQGRNTLRRALPRWQKAQGAAISALGAEDFARLSKALSLSNKLNESGENA